MPGNLSIEKSMKRLRKLHATVPLAHLVEKLREQGFDVYSRRLLVLFWWFSIVLVGWLAIWWSNPPELSSKPAISSAFSAKRALQLLEPLVHRPHPLGSAEHDRVRDALLTRMSELGLSPWTETWDSSGRFGRREVAARITNLYGRLRGSQSSGRPVVLVAHYDSVAAGPGAADDGAGLVTVLETLRALEAGPKLRADVLVLFTDGEEVGMLGAAAAVQHDSWLGPKCVLLNFEARGSSGPVQMFETSEGNARLIAEFASSARFPTATSLAYSLYTMLPNETDFSIFRTAGVVGMNFAAIENTAAYHTPADTVEALSTETLQQYGELALSSTRHFANLADGSSLQASGDAVYFNPIAHLLVCYPTRLVRYQALAFSLLVLLVVWWLAARGNTRHFLKLIVLVLSIFLTAVGTPYLLFAVVTRVAGARLTMNDSPLEMLAAFGAALAGLGAGAAIYHFGRRSFTATSMIYPALIVATLLADGLGLVLPAAGYLLLWPLLTAAAGAAALQWLNGTALRALHWVLLALLVLWFAPLGRALLSLVGPSPIGASVLGFLFACLLLDAMFCLDAWVPTGATAWGAVGGSLSLLLISVLLTHPTPRSPRRDSLAYAVRADTQQAVWVSTDENPDRWTAEALGKHPRREEHVEFAFGSSDPLLVAPATQLGAPLEGADVEDVSMVRKAAGYQLHMRVSSRRSGDEVQLVFPPGLMIAGGQVEHLDLHLRRIVHHGSSATSLPPLNLLRLMGYGGGADVELRISGSGCRFWVTEVGYALPADGALKIEPRPAAFVPASGYAPGVMVSQPIELCGPGKPQTQSAQRVARP